MGYSPWGRKESDITEPLNSNSKSFLSQSSPQVWLNTEPNLTVRDQKLCPQLPGKPDTCKDLAIAKMGGFPGGSVVKNQPANERHRFNSWVGKILWRSEWQPSLVFLPGKSLGQRSLVGYSPWGRKELDTTEQLSTFTFIRVLESDL